MPIADAHCLVIGGGGNLGGYLIRLLLEHRVASVASYDVVPYAGDGAAKVVNTIDVAGVGSLTNAMQGVTVVFHTASIIDIRPKPSARMRRVNVDGTANVVQACQAAHVERLVYTSSLEVVSGVGEDGTTRKVMGADESMPIPAHHHLPYASTKAAAERLVLAANSPTLRTVSIRPGYIQGPGSIELRVEMVRANQRANRYVTALVPARISTVHPRNAAHAHVLAAEKLHQTDVAGQSFFVRDFEANVVEMALAAFSDTPIIPVILPLALAYALAYILDKIDRILHVLAALVGIMYETSDEVLDIKAVNMAYIDIIVSSKRAEQVLGYRPLVSEAECMSEAARWCKSFYANLRVRLEALLGANTRMQHPGANISNHSDHHTAVCRTAVAQAHGIQPTLELERQIASIKQTYQGAGCAEP